MRILVIGKAGQLARALADAGTEIVCLGRPSLDMAARDMIAPAVERVRPDLIVNAAAYTSVDRAESEPGLAFAVNAEGAAELARVSATMGIPIVHVSTDYVFDGQKTTAYREDDVPNPLGVYGASKEAGERAVREGAPRHVIVRTSRVFSVVGDNFLRTMLRLAGERTHLRVVKDQVASPTAAGDLAGALLAIAERIRRDGEVPWGTYHFCGTGGVSWYQFACAIFDGSRQIGTRLPTIEPISHVDRPVPARRPGYSVLACSKIEAAFGIVPRPWQDMLDDVMAQLRGK